MQSFLSRGTIYPSRFVKTSLEQDNCVNQAGAGDAVKGISQEWIHDAPIPGAGTDAASSGELVKVYDLGETCLLELGGTVTRGDYLKSDSNGKGVTASSTDEAGAYALESGTSGLLIRVSVINRKA